VATATVVVPRGTTDVALAALLRGPATTLAGGGLVAFPTETVYGLGADATSPAAVERIFLAKGRPVDNPLIVHLPDRSWLDRVAASVTPLADRLAEACWPGPLTLVLEARAEVPRATTGGLSTVAVRVPDDPLARCLIELAGTPVAAPSANLSGRPSPTTAAHVEADLADRIDWIVDGGPCAVGIESTIVDVRGADPVVLREGAVTREDLAALAATPVTAGADAPRAPGGRHVHYRPAARVVVADPGRGADVARTLADRGPVGLIAPDGWDLDPRITVLARPLGATALAVELYAGLRRADQLGLPAVVVEAVEAHGIGRAVMDRLRRASGA
jgi:L-threonylcarbamoyladenylate synthase